MKWILFLIITRPPHGFNTHLIEVANELNCNNLGKSLVENIEDTRNPDSGWIRSARINPKYKCFKITGE